MHRKHPLIPLALLPLLLLGGCVAPASPEIPNPLELVAGRGGRIESAHLTAAADGAYVAGYVAKVGFAELPRGTHVEIVVLDAQKNVLGQTSEEFLPGRIPEPGRFGQPHSFFRVHLAALPPPDATVRIIFRDGPGRS